MQNISNIIKNKKIFSVSRDGIDQKTIESLFWKIVNKQVRGVLRADIKKVFIKDKKLYISTSQPVAAAEIFRKRQKICDAINDLVGKVEISDLKIK